MVAAVVRFDSFSLVSDVATVVEVAVDVGRSLAMCREDAIQPNVRIINDAGMKSYEMLPALASRGRSGSSFAPVLSSAIDSMNARPRAMVERPRRLATKPIISLPTYLAS